MIKALADPGGTLEPWPPCPQYFFKIMQFSGNFKGNPLFLQILGSGPPWPNSRIRPCKRKPQFPCWKKKLVICDLQGNETSMQHAAFWTTAWRGPNDLKNRTTFVLQMACNTPTNARTHRSKIHMHFCLECHRSLKVSVTPTCTTTLAKEIGPTETRPYKFWNFSFFQNNNCYQFRLSPFTAVCDKNAKSRAGTDAQYQFSFRKRHEEIWKKKAPKLHWNFNCLIVLLFDGTVICRFRELPTVCVPKLWHVSWTNFPFPEKWAKCVTVLVFATSVASAAKGDGKRDFCASLSVRKQNGNE